MVTRQSPEDPAATSAKLRALALSRAPEELKFAPAPSSPNVFCVLMETGMKGAVFTMVCFFDGATSLYFSSGGGVIGCGEHVTVAAAAKSLIAFANKCADRCAPTAEFPLPALGMVRFYLRTPSGTVTYSAAEKDLGEKRDPLWPLFFMGHAVITRIRELGLV